MARLLAPAIVLVVACNSTNDAPSLSADASDSGNSIGRVQSAQVACTVPPSGPTHCDDNCDCPTGQVCTLDWNRGILYQLEAVGLASQFGHCVDPSTSPADDGAAVQADLDALAQLWTTTATGYAGIQGSGIPYGLPDRAELKLDSGLDISFRILLNGNGALVRVPRDVDAFTLAPGSSLSRIKDLRIDIFEAAATHAGVGVDIGDSHIRLENLFISRMGSGVRVDSSSSGNLVAPRLRNLLINQGHVHGVHFEGPTSRGGLIEGLSFGNYPVAIYENSRYGNTYVGNHMEQNTVGLRADSPNQQNNSTFVGNYIENVDEIDMDPLGASRMTIAGGQFATRSYETAGDTVGSRASRLEFSGEADDGGTITVRIPGAGAAGAGAMSWRYQPPFPTCNSRWLWWNLMPEPGLARPSGAPTSADYRRAWHFVYDNQSVNAREPSLTITSDVTAPASSCPGLVGYGINRIEYDSQTVCDYGVGTCGF